MLLQLLDLLLLITMLGAPWILLVFALSALRDQIRHDRWLLFAVAVGTWLVLLTQFSPLTEVLSQQMIHTQTTPWFAAFRQTVLVERRAPLWLSQLGVGMPALANPYTGYFSPFTTLLLFFKNLDMGVNVLVFVHLAFTAVTTTLLGRSLGLRRVSSVLMALAVVFNPWIFRRLSPEVHAMYLLGFAWVPLAWALTVRFLRTRSVGDAVRVGVPLGFMAVTLMTVFALVFFAIFFLACTALVDPLWRRRWREAAGAAGALLLMVVSVFLAAAPEHVGLAELARTNEQTRLSGGRIQGGWRDRAFTSVEFLRLLLPNEIGKRLVPVHYSVNFFGVPFSPGDAVVLFAVLGMGGALMHREWRRRTAAVPHLLLFLVLANVATHGVAYEALHRFYSLWAVTGNWPVLGALVLMIIVIFFGVGIETSYLIFRYAGRWLGHRLVALRSTPVPRLLVSPTIRWAVSKFLAVVLLLLLVTEMLFGIGGVIRNLRGLDPDGRAELRYTVSTMRMSDFARMPHLALLGSLSAQAELPPRVFCTGDRRRWPSSCFDFLVDRYHLEAVGPGDWHWALPWWQWQTAVPFWGSWADRISLLDERLLQLSSVDYLVSTRDLGYPLVSTVRWDPAPGDFELWGAVVNNTGGGPWKEGWDQTLWIQRFPKSAPRVFFADGVLLTGRASDAQTIMRARLADPGFHPRKIILAPADPKTQALLARSLPAVDASPAGASAAASFFAAHPSRARPPTAVKLSLRQRGSGCWVAEGHTPREGLLQFSQLWYPGFRATVNGQSVPVLRSDLFFSAVPVPAGDVTVTLAYEPLSVYLASLLTFGFAMFSLRATARMFLRKIVVSVRP